MTEEEFEFWLHASDEERANLHNGWSLDNDEGKEIVEAVANLLKEECVYNVDEVAVIKEDGEWKILAYASDDYDSLKARHIDFLGFKLVFKKTG